MISKEGEIFKFRMQSNISSHGHNNHRVSKIRFEQGEIKGNAVTLKYIVEIKKIASKENAGIRGYNYTKDEIYKIPIRAKIITIELYEDFTDNLSDTKPCLIAQQTFNFVAHM